MEEALKAAGEKFLVDHHHDACQQELDQTHGHMISFKKCRQGPAEHHVPHGKIHEHEQKSQRSQKASFEDRRLPVLQGVPVGGGMGIGGFGPLQRRAVARLGDGGDDGLSFYRQIAREAGAHLHHGGMLAVETGWDQTARVSGLLQEAGFYDLHTYRDLAGRDRVVTGRWRMTEDV